MQVNNISILSTRDLGSAITSGLQDDHPRLQVDTVPFVELEPIVDETLRLQVLSLAKNSALVIFTSKHAVRSVAAMLGLQPGNSLSIPWLIACLQGKTREEVIRFFPELSIRYTGANAKQLSLEMLSDRALPPSGNLFFAGDRRMDDLPDALQQAGIGFTEVVVYRTIDRPVRILKSYDAILFFSPSAVSSYFQVNQPGPQTVLFCIGDTTGDALKKQTRNLIVVSSEPSMEGVLNAVEKHYKLSA